MYEVHSRCPVLAPDNDHKVYRYTSYDEAKDMFDFSVKVHRLAVRGLRLDPNCWRRATITLEQDGANVIHKGVI